MFAAFNLKMKKNFDYYIDMGNEVYVRDRERVETEFNQFLKRNGNLKEASNQDDWFSHIKADIFIAHSPLDKGKALALSGWLQSKFKLNAYIDSSIWDPADSFLKKMDEKYEKHINESYNPKKRHLCINHVYTLLSTALTHIMDNTECIIFLNPPSTVSTKEVMNQTTSPWAYLELAISKRLRKKIPVRSQENMKQEPYKVNDSLMLEYHLGTHHLANISDEDLQKWNLYFNLNKLKRLAKSPALRAIHPLDFLYKKHGFMKETIEQ